MATKPKREVQWGKAKITGEKASKTDDLRNENRSVDARSSRRPPDKIKPRYSGNTREIDLLHVLELAESIEALGLLQPVAIDKKGYLIAGEHRLKACQILFLEDSNAKIEFWENLKSTSLKTLKDQNKIDDARIRLKKLDTLKFKNRYKDGEIPVAVLPFDSTSDIEQAMLAETAENEKRQNYTKKEILTLAEKLKDAGYIERPGRPKLGEKSLKNALSVISGKSWRQIYRDMQDEKTMTHDRVFNERKELEKISKSLIKFIATLPDHHLSKTFMAISNKIQKSLDK